MKFLSAHTATRENNFHIVRLLAAIAVLVSHSFAIATGDPAQEPLRSLIGMTPGTIAVDIFFVISGYLVSQSLCRSESVVHFFWSRVLRIYPALVFMVFFTGLACVFFSTLSASEYLSSKQLLKYLVKNSTLWLGVEFTLPEVFPHNPTRTVINGSLWSLPEEVRMYAYLVGLWVVSQWLTKTPGRLFKGLSLLLAVATGAVYFATYFWALELPFPKTLARLAFMFFTGVSLQLHAHRIPASGMLASVLLGLMVLGAAHASVFFVLYHACVAYITLVFCLVPHGPVWRRLDSPNDYSYGIYIWGFPLQQLIMHLRPETSAIALVVLSLALTFPFAWLSWHLIEKRFVTYRQRMIGWTMGLAPHRQSA